MVPPRLSVFLLVAFHGIAFVVSRGIWVWLRDHEEKSGCKDHDQYMEPTSTIDIVDWTNKFVDWKVVSEYVCVMIMARYCILLYKYPEYRIRGPVAIAIVVSHTFLLTTPGACRTNSASIRPPDIDWDSQESVVRGFILFPYLFTSNFIGTCFEAETFLAAFCLAHDWENNKEEKWFLFSFLFLWEVFAKQIQIPVAIASVAVGVSISVVSPDTVRSILCGCRKRSRTVEDVPLVQTGRRDGKEEESKRFTVVDDLDLSPDHTIAEATTEEDKVEFDTDPESASKV